MLNKKKFLTELALKNAALLLVIAPAMILFTLNSMQHMEAGNQSAILAVIGLLMASAIVGIFETTYQKSVLEKPLQRWLAHLTKALLYIGVTELMAIAIAAVGTTYPFWDDPLIWALSPIYLALYLFDCWDGLIAADSLS
ncbi:hypothetical protein EUZ85_14980 [Hahella sp. KA22]|uniref:hypothetical protein n=1 Tax=Hahella sp. KA22 TaxID=1628392 RepID=UPI000FDDC228|nr:hypothetical protein [Hahella sp. KA22]AZZ91964.1 hypothetical protein ENC22_12415 [Hahella sp. KA22]QAY55335.1 hypothetical protein EUZ85_14980 [Hahella sp. KA22]